MKKGFKVYALIWAIELAVFNVVCFVTPDEIAGMPKYGGVFWAGYIFVTLAFLGQLACGYKAFSAPNAGKMFLSLPLIGISYAAVTAMMITASVCLAYPRRPLLWTIVCCVITLGANVIAVVKAGAAAAIVSHLDDKVAEKTSFLKMLTVDAGQLTHQAVNAEAQAAVKKVADALRYSDPMSAPALQESEAEIAEKFTAFAAAIKAGDDVTALADSLLAAIAARNAKCKVLK